MKTQKLLFLMTSVSSLLFSCTTSSSSSNQSNPDSSKGESTSQESRSGQSSLPNYKDLDHVKVFVSKDTNLVEYDHIYAWGSDDQPIIGQWPGTTLTNYDEDWLSYDFDKSYTNFSIILNNGDKGQQTSHSGMSINGIGAYWYYNDSLVKNDTMPDLHPGGGESSSSQYDPPSPTPSNNEYGNIFHAFDWNLNTIKNNLSEISKAGYTAIQTSPLQRPKEYNGDWDTSNWWRLYQPWSFDVPNDNTYLGTSNDLKSLTAAAHKLNLKIIVDVVANHMGGNDNELDYGVVETAIKNNKNETIRTVNQCSNWNNRYDVTHYRLGGYPELNTGNKIVQDTVYKYLKSLVDYGVDGFRFDAAKHIETPYDDNNIKSDFWTNTATKTYTYAKETYDKKLYMYGEILDNCAGVPFDYYTNILDAITDNRTGNNILSAVRSGNSNGAGNSHYETNVSPDKLVLWGESHDTYMNTPEYGGISRDANQKDVDKAYALVASRKGARGLYFCRPNWSSKLNNSQPQSDSYKNKLISSVNKLKNDMGSNNETVGSSDSLAYVARYGDNGYGATIVNVNGSGRATLSISNLVNGTYKDLISGETYTMKNGSITINISNDYGATVIELVR